MTASRLDKVAATVLAERLVAGQVAATEVAMVPAVIPARVILDPPETPEVALVLRTATVSPVRDDRQERRQPQPHAIRQFRAVLLVQDPADSDMPDEEVDVRAES